MPRQRSNPSAPGTASRSSDAASFRRNHGPGVLPREVGRRPTQATARRRADGVLPDEPVRHRRNDLLPGTDLADVEADRGVFVGESPAQEATASADVSGVHITVRTPPPTSWSPRIASWAATTSSSTRRAGGTSSQPAEAGTRRRVVRWNREIFTSRNRARIEPEKVGVRQVEPLRRAPRTSVVHHSQKVFRLSRLAAGQLDATVRHPARHLGTERLGRCDAMPWDAAGVEGPGRIHGQGPAGLQVREAAAEIRLRGTEVLSQGALRRKSPCCKRKP